MYNNAPYDTLYTNSNPLLYGRSVWSAHTQYSKWGHCMVSQWLRAYKLCCQPKVASKFESHQCQSTFFHLNFAHPGHCPGVYTQLCLRNWVTVSPHQILQSGCWCILAIGPTPLTCAKTWVYRYTDAVMYGSMLNMALPDVDKCPWTSMTVSSGNAICTNTEGSFEHTCMHTGCILITFQSYPQCVMTQIHISTVLVEHSWLTPSS